MHPDFDSLQTLNRSRRDRYVLLDAMRGVAAIIVMLGHLGWSVNMQGWLVQHYYLAVDLFFALSGFVIADAYLEKFAARKISFGGFLTARIIRLYPMMLVGTCTGLAVAVCLKDANIKIIPTAVIAKQFAAGLLLEPFLSVDGVSPIGFQFPLNSPMWSLFWELVANVGFAWLAIRTRLTGWIAIVGFFGVILIGSALTHNGLTRGPHDWSGGFVRVGFSFYSGVCLWQLRDRIRLPKTPVPILLSILVISLAVPMIPHLNMFYDIIISMFLFPAIILISSKTALSGRWIGASELLGGISYPLYALHYPFVELMKPLYKTLGGGWFVGAGMLLSGTILLPLLSYGVLHWFDEPVRIWLRSKLMVRQLARAQTAP